MASVPGLEGLSGKDVQSFTQWLKNTINNQITEERERVYTPADILKMIPATMKGAGRGPNDLIPSVGVVHDAAISIAHNTSITLGTTAGTTTVFNTKEWDNDFMWNAGAPGTLTVKRPGIYLCSAYGFFAADAGGERYLNILATRVGGNLNAANRGNPSSTNTQADFTPVMVANMRAGDKFQLQAYQTNTDSSTINLTAGTRFNATKIANIFGEA